MITLKKFGFPPHFCDLVRAFHTNLKVKIEVGDKDVEVDSTTGVKQGCTLASILFTFRHVLK